MQYVKVIKTLVNRGYQTHPGFRKLQQSVDGAQVLSAKTLIKAIQAEGLLKDISDAEFRVFSQFGDDGIIQYLIHAVAPKHRTFIEFGSSNYVESNTRFLVECDDWRGLLIDGSRDNIDYIKRDPIYWRHDLTAIAAFITSDNINQLFQDGGFGGEIGLLSIDIDGNDYWVWDAITTVNPVIVVAEYNAIFGGVHAVTVPYDPVFSRFTAHPSGLFWGASLKALCLVAERKGYALVGCNTAGNNAYFVRKDALGNLKPVTPESGFRDASWSDSRDAAGNLTFLRGGKKLEAIQDMTVIDVANGRTCPLRAL